MCSDVVIRAEGLTKNYRVFNQSADRLKQAVTLGRRQYYKRFTALDNVSFEIRKGESVGIVGRNGSGKSTLLQLVCGILKPSAGRVEVNGRISALLELGAGFHPDFTGRENVLFYATVLGMPRDQIEGRLPEIEAFADIGEFMDQPVRAYSSGMFVRLAFATAIHTDPDLLVVDEALAVGDAAFQAKCLRRITELRNDGVSILLVSHALDQVTRFCDRALLLESGQLYAEGDAAAIAKRYYGIVTAGSPRHRGRISATPVALPATEEEFLRAPLIPERFSLRPTYNPLEKRVGTREAELVDFLICASGGEAIQVVDPGQTIDLLLRVLFHRDVASPVYGLTIRSPTGEMLFMGNSLGLPATIIGGRKKEESIVIRFRLRPALMGGTYTVTVGVSEEHPGEVVALDRRYDSIHLTCQDSRTGTGTVDMQLSIEEAVSFA